MATEPRDIDDLRQLAREDPDRAIETAASFPPPEAAAFLASIAPELSRPSLDHALRVAREIPDLQWRANALRDLAGLLREDERVALLREARALLEEQVSGDGPGQVAAMLLQARIAQDLGDFREAEQRAREAASAAVNDREGTDALITLAQILAEQGDIDEPRALFERAVELAPDGELRSAAEEGLATLLAYQASKPPREEDQPPPAPRGPSRPSAAVARDFWTAQDRLGYDFYADAIAEFIRHRDTRPPFTIGIKAPWGAGKTSLMRMVRALLDPAADAGTVAASSGTVAVTNAAVLASTREAPQQRDLGHADQAMDTAANTRTTVWFNAWKYQSGEQVWSGLAHAIISQLTARMKPVERERFWATLNLRRVDGEAVRRRIYRVLLERLLPLLVAAVITWVLALGAWLLAPALPSTETIRGIAGGSVLVSVVGFALAALAQRKKFLQESVKGSFAELVRVPDYAGKAGYMHAVHEDMRHVLGMVATENRPVVVFVDDLDRCSYESVAKVIEAINLFLAGEFPNCIFVLAMEPDLVAAQIQVAYKDLFAAVAQDAPVRERGSLGWRFLEKMVQLPLSLPPPEPRQVEVLVDSILNPTRTAAAPSEASVSAARDEIKRVAQGGIEDVVAATRKLMGDGADASYIRAAEQEFAEQFSDQDETVQRLIRESAAALSRNPREIKRFINVFRFYAFIQVRREVRGLPAPSYDQVAKIAVLAVRWPHLLGYLGQDDEKGETILTVLERLAREEEQWSADAFALAQVSDRRSTELVDDDELRDLLRADPAVAADAKGFL